ncbi:uncharacterized protein LOC120288755 [Eucalyptus grandis]|uniref:uncharacterized protein LOC120288755 n=1 Tax=Eucalyptus grandis TaxID=71139 RepID=UPI00192EC8B2|nr:uncharacterized protein LOC120288755 [Eucalyptus grandis]
MRDDLRFSKEGKLKQRYLGPFEILGRIETLVYRLALLPRLAQVHDVFHVLRLRTYEPDPTHALNLQELDVDDRVSYVKSPIQIVNKKDWTRRTKIVPLVEVV